MIHLSKNGFFPRHKTISRLIVLFLLVLGGISGRYIFLSNVSAQTENAPINDMESLHASIKLFFENLSDTNKGPQKAFEDILKNSPLATDEKIVADLTNGLKEINTRFGSYLSFEEIGSKSIGSDLVVIRYLYKCQNYPVVWYFTFYRPLPKTSPTTSPTQTRNWLLIGLRYDSNLDIALSDSSF